jgi:hypothetical protein
METINIYDDKDQELVFTECKTNIYKLEEISRSSRYELELINAGRPVYVEKGNTESSSIYVLSYANNNLDDGPTAYIYTY